MSTLADKYPGGAGGGLIWSVISSDTTGSKDNGYMIDASSNTVTLDFPATPSVGDSMGVKVTDKTNAVVLGRNGSNIEGDAEDMTIDIADAGMTFVYNGATLGWVVVTEINGGGATSGVDIAEVMSLMA